MVNLTAGIVTLSLGEYNRLRELDESIRNGKKLTLKDVDIYYNCIRGSSVYYTDAEIHTDILSRNESLCEEIVDLQNQLTQLEDDKRQLTNKYTHLVKYTKSLEEIYNNMIKADMFKFFSLKKKGKKVDFFKDEEAN